MKSTVLFLSVFILSIAAEAQLSFDYRLLIDYPFVNNNKFKLVDLGSDGDLDVFAGEYFLLNEKGSYVLDSIKVYEESPLYNYLPYTYLISKGLYTILDIEDSNGDGIFEMFILNIKQKRIEVKVNYKKTSEFFDIGLSFLNYDKLVFYDADNDGYKDYVLGNEDGIVIYQNSRFFNREQNPIYQYKYTGAAKQTGTGQLVVNDFNKDGELDIFNGSIFFYKKPFKTDFEVSGTLHYHNIPFSIRNIQVADVTNSAFPSLMGDVDFNKEKIPFSSFILNQKDSVFQNHSAQKVADLDNDGLLDYIFVENNILKYTTKNGTFNFNQSGAIQIDAIKYVGDIDQNGFLDVIATSKTEIYLLSQKNVAENMAPIAPKMNLSLEGNLLKISWEPGNDDKTAKELLQYNLTITASDATFEESISFPIISSDIGAKQNKPKYIQTPAIGANVGYVLNKTIALNFDITNISINISAIDNKERISVPAYSKLDYSFHPFELSVDSMALGERNTRFELSVADMDADESMDYLVQKKDVQDSLKCYFKNAVSWKALKAKLAKAQANTQMADLGNDGNLDLVVENGTSALEKVSFNVSNDSFETSPISGLNAANAFKYVFDEDCDGDLDIFYSNDSLDLLANAHFLIYNKAGQFESPVATDKLILHSSDFNDDGENDVLTLNKNKDGYSISLLTQRGNSYFETQSNLYKLSGNTKHLSAIQIERFDVNGDGVFELVIQEKEASVCAILERNFSGGFSQTKLFTNSNFVFADYNNDGLIDLFELNSAGIYQNKGGFNFTANRYTPTFRDISVDEESGAKNNYKATIAVDFDSDSLCDFVSVDDAGLLFFKNNLSVDKNKAPSVPSKLKAETFEDTVSLTWQKSVDKDSSTGLFYNIQLWKKETNQYLTPIHSLPDGRLLLNGKYTSISNKHVFRQLTGGTYYWKVQAIDAGNLPSVFSEIDSFKVVIQPSIKGNLTVCNYDIDTFYVSPRSEHYTWQVSGGTIVDSSDGTINVEWHESGFQQVKISNTKFQLSDSAKIEVKSNPIPTINYHFPDSSSALKLLFETNNQDLIQNYTWDINGSLYSDATPTHLFSLSGKYATKIDVVYKNGCKNKVTRNVDLFYPKIEGKKVVCGTSEEIYKANPKGLEYKWEVEGGLVLSANNESLKVKWEESTTQAKSVKLINKKYQYADSIKIGVFPVPKADFEIPENIGIGSLVQFKNTAIENSTYSWDFDEPENVSSETNPVVSFSVQGQHKIHLKVKNNFGCEVDVTKVVIVSGEVSAILIANFLTPNADGKNDLLFIENIERYPENEVKLYAAWGTEIFSQSNYQNDWDLRKGDEYISSGNYLCVVELKKFGKRFEKIVTVTR